MPSVGVKLLGKSSEQRHESDALAEPGATVYVLQSVTAHLSLVRRCTWLFKVKCHFTVETWCSAKYASTS